LSKVLYGYSCPYHKELIDQLNPDDTIITFNWDLLVDNLISSQEGYSPNYAFEFAKTYKAEEWQNDKPETKHPKLLKLHGSLNWMYCKKCKKSYNYVLKGKVTTDTILNPEAQWLKCPGCNSQLEPIIIPPTMNKNYEKWNIIKQIWERAHEALVVADEVTIIGYSLPVTDFRTKWLFMKVCAERTQPLNKLTVVDKYPNGLFAKYKQLFNVDDDKFEGIVGEIKCLVNGIKSEALNPK